MPRLTVRNVSPEAILAIKAFCAETGVTMGEALTASITAGLDKARQQLQSPTEPVVMDPVVRHELTEAFEELRQLMAQAKLLLGSQTQPTLQL